MTGIGPAEPVNSPKEDGSHDIIGIDAPRLTDRVAAHWTTLPPRARRTALAAGAACLTAAAALLLAPTGTPDRDDRPPPVPWPANVTTWHYLGLAQLPASPETSHSPTPRTTHGRLRFAVAVTAAPRHPPSHRRRLPRTPRPHHPRARLHRATPEQPTGSPCRYP
jgi:hypothetical protein